MNQALDPDKNNSSAEPLTVFSLLWAAAILFQLLSTTWWPDQLQQLTAIGLIETALILSALWLLAKPQSRRILLLLLALQIVDVWLNLPRIPNHRLLSAFVSLALLLACVLQALGPGSRRLPEKTIFQRFAPAGRLALILLYFFAAFSKLNYDFLNPDVSCAAEFYQNIAGWMPLVPTAGWALQAAIYLTLLVELTLPFLLIMRRTRNQAILLATAFHFIIALDVGKHFFDFSATVYALLFLFMPGGVLTFWSAESIRRRGRLLFLAFVALSLAALDNGSESSFLFFFFGRQLLWTVFSLGFVILFLLALGHGRDWQPPASHILRPGPILLLIPLLVFLNGLGPYAGFRTQSAFDMYSNLRLDGERSNHLLLSSGLDLWGYQSDLVTILDSSDSHLQESYIQAGRQMTYFEFQDYAGSRPDIDVTYERNGTLFQAEPAGNQPELSSKPPLLLRKLLRFRPVDSHQEVRCQW